MVCESPISVQSGRPHVETTHKYVVVTPQGLFLIPWSTQQVEEKCAIFKRITFWGVPFNMKDGKQYLFFAIFLFSVFWHNNEKSKISGTCLIKQIVGRGESKTNPLLKPGDKKIP